MSEAVRVGVVSHFYGKAGVAVVKLEGPLAIGDTIVVKAKGGEERFSQVVESLQVDHASVQSGKKGEEVAVKVSGKVHSGDQICKA